jgi:hypothetical protein
MYDPPSATTSKAMQRTIQSLMLLISFPLRDIACDDACNVPKCQFTVRIIVSINTHDRIIVQHFIPRLNEVI